MRGHGGQVEGVGALGTEGGADEAASVGGHEGDVFGGDEAGGGDEVGFVFALGVVGDDDDFPGGNGGDDVLDGAKF